MKRGSRIGAFFLPAAVLAAVMAHPAKAKAPAGSSLQRIGRGPDGVVAGGITCPRVHQARLCSPGTKPTCPAGGC